MADVAVSRGIEIDERALSERLKLPVVKTEAHRRRGTDDLRKMIVSAADEMRDRTNGRMSFHRRSPPNVIGSTNDWSS